MISVFRYCLFILLFQICFYGLCLTNFIFYTSKQTQTTIDACGCASESKCVNSICYCNVGYTGLTCSQKIPVDDASTRLSAATDSTLVRGHQQYRWVMMVFMASFGLMWFSPAIVKRCNRKKDKHSMWHR